MKNFLKWASGLMFIVMAGVFIISESLVEALPALLLGLFLIPPILDWFQKKINYTFSKALKWIIAIGLFILIGSIQIAADKLSDSGVDSLVEQASEEIDNGNMEVAYKLISQAKNEYSDNQNNPAVSLENEIRASKGDKNAKKALARMTDEEFELFQKGELTKNYLDQKTLNKNFYILIKEFENERPQLVAKFQASELAYKRSKAVDSQFYADGSHPTLERTVKSACHNSDSFEHIETTHVDEGDLIRVIMHYKAENGFGAIRKNIVVAKVDLYGNVVEIVSQH